MPVVLSGPSIRSVGLPTTFSWASGAVSQDDRTHRDQREGIGGAVAHLVVDVRATHRLGQRHRRDQLTRLQHGLYVRRLTWQPVEVGDRNAPHRAVRPYRFHRRIERAHRHGHVARMGGDACLAHAHDRMLAAESTDCRAAATGLAFVARLVGVVEIGATGALEQIARGRRLVAQLARGAREQRPRKQA